MAKAGLEIESSQAIGSDGTIYFGSRDRKFYALTPDGKLRWSFLNQAAKKTCVAFEQQDNGIDRLFPAETI